MQSPIDTEVMNQNVSVVVSPNSKSIDAVANKTVLTKMFQIPLPDPDDTKADLLLPKLTRLHLQKRFGVPLTTAKEMQQLVPNSTFYNTRKEFRNA